MWGLMAECFKRFTRPWQAKSQAFTGDKSKLFVSTTQAAWILNDRSYENENLSLGLKCNFQ